MLGLLRLGSSKAKAAGSTQGNWLSLFFALEHIVTTRLDTTSFSFGKENIDGKTVDENLCHDNLTTLHISTLAI
jgi:hypothetical protein